MAKLPPLMELMEHFHKGLTDPEIAEMYGVRRQAVSKAFRDYGVVRFPVKERVGNLLRDVLGVQWHGEKRGSHHQLAAAKYVRSYLRWRLNDPSLSDRQVTDAKVWCERLKRDEVVLGYDPTTEKGWFYRPRTPEDGRLVLAWPAGKELPQEPDLRQALELP